MHPVPSQDETGEMSWPLVERRSATRLALDADRRQVGDSERFTDLTRANELLLSLQKMAVTLSSSLDVDEVVRRGVEQARSVVRADAVIVLLLDPDTSSWIVMAGPSEILRDPSLVPNPDILRCTESARPVVLEDHLLWSAASHGVYQALKARGTVMGLIGAEWTGDRRPTTAEREAIVGIADAIALALDNARIFASLADRAATDERTRVARELHDRMSSSLAAIGFDLDRIARHTDGDTRESILDVRRSLGDTIDEVRSLLDELRDSGRTAAFDRESISALAHAINERSGITVTCEVSEIATLAIPEHMADELMLVTREALFNAERHSSARNIRVRFETAGNDLLLSVADDGIGVGSAPPGHGISGMRERTEWIGATLDIESSPHGTTVSVRVPRYPET
ncbi:MAG: histidine kinase [Ilumatobacteraceae bacterium]